MKKTTKLKLSNEKKVITIQPKKPEPLFIIEGYDREVKDGYIIVECEKNDILIPVEIPEKKFHLFLREEDKLSWIMDSSDHTGEHVQASGDMSYEEYWNCETRYIYEDLYEYITTHPINFRGKIYENALESLLPAFER